MNRRFLHLPRDLNATSIGCGNGSISKVTRCLGITFELVDLMVQAYPPAELEHERRLTYGKAHP